MIDWLIDWCVDRLVWLPEVRFSSLGPLPEVPPINIYNGHQNAGPLKPKTQAWPCGLVVKARPTKESECRWNFHTKGIFTKCCACHPKWDCDMHAVATWRSPDNAIRKKYLQHDMSKVLRMPRKINMEVSKVVCLARKRRVLFWNPRKVWRLPHRTTFDTQWNMLGCHKAPHLPHETTLHNVWNLQKWPLLQQSL